MSQARNVTATFAVGTLTMSSLTPARGSDRGRHVGRGERGGLRRRRDERHRGRRAGANVAVRSATRALVRHAGAAGRARQSSSSRRRARPDGTFTFVAARSRRLTGARRPSFSFDGRYMAFESTVALVADDTNGVADVYVFDKVAGALPPRQRLQRRRPGAGRREPERRDQRHRPLRRVRVARRRTSCRRDGNGLLDVFLHDRDVDNDGVFDEPGAIRTVRVSVGTGGAEALRGFSRTRRSAATAGGWPSSRRPPTWSPATPTAGSTSASTIACSGRRPALNVPRAARRRWTATACAPPSASTAATSPSTRRGQPRRRRRQRPARRLRPRPRHRRRRRHGRAGLRRDRARQRVVERGRGDRRRQHARLDHPGRPLRRLRFHGRQTSSRTTPNGESDIFLRDRLNGTTRRLSVGPNGERAAGPEPRRRASAPTARCWCS